MARRTHAQRPTIPGLRASKLTARLSPEERRGITFDVRSPSPPPFEHPPQTEAGRPPDELRNPEYLVTENLLRTNDANALIRAVQTEPNWSLHEKWFFSQYDAKWVINTFDTNATGKITPEIKALVRAGAELIDKRFDAVVGTHYKVIAHKMMPGQVISIHNDSPEGARGRNETHRFIYYPNHYYSDGQGGHLLLFSSSEETAVEAVIRPVFNSAALMRLSDNSYHAVSRVSEGVRYAIVVSYWAYPVLFRGSDQKNVIKACLSALLRAGTEKVPYSGTNLSSHLYYTFEMLFRWGAPLSICLAGLMGRALGDRSTGLPPHLTWADVAPLVDEYSLAIVRTLQSGSPVNKGTSLARDVKLVELASTFEQAETSEAIDRGCAALRELDALDVEMRIKIDAEINRLRAEAAAIHVLQ
ncbi:2OG-Fe(II) oxygenase (plasmid) [Ensifer sp. D2-11]